MLKIKFRYRDDLNYPNWSEQECIVDSLEDCKKIYGLDDCEYEILSQVNINNGFEYTGSRRDNGIAELEFCLNGTYYYMFVPEENYLNRLGYNDLDLSIYTEDWDTINLVNINKYRANFSKNEVREYYNLMIFGNKEGHLEVI